MTTTRGLEPSLCLVTDRLAFAAFLGVPEPDAALVLEEQVAAAAAAGVTLVHVRERDLGARELARLVARLVERAKGSRTRVVVNDRYDVALAAAADGVHLRGDSLPTAAVRHAAPPGFAIGRSVRRADAASREGEAGADYVVLGTIYPTPSKPGDQTVVGVAELARAAATSHAPVLGIGGITEERIPEIAATGAAGFAAIRLFWQPRLDRAAFATAVAGWRRQFDLHRPNT